MKLALSVPFATELTSKASSPCRERLAGFEKEGGIVRENDNLLAHRFSHEAFDVVFTCQANNLAAV